MDKYYIDLTRDSLSEAQVAISKSQQFARDAKLPEWLEADIQRLLNKARRISDDLSKIKVFE